jgi:hypothetical protein
LPCTEDADAVLTMLAVSAGDVSETQFASWIRSRSVELK